MRQSIFECEQARLCELGVVDEVFSGVHVFAHIYCIRSLVCGEHGDAALCLVATNHIEVKGSGDVSVAAEAPMYDVEWRENNAKGGDPLQNDAATLVVMNDASTMAATGALVNCTSRSGLRWRQPYTRLAATTSSTWCSLLAHKKSAER